ncbi:hypothetical protein CROQUDRAFT_664506 [Cronartium quercuum f. sp. fusiforme G11]|uniref:Sec1-like protein n=1 Tax=Cronartium quercuum f. sp. fusiforme G11 TaxID=708437 RepID=A0A9P6N7A0_9BASI|nr:hypothetical protein CROQUDRAFT_664506 [Cronartium quercuum f. sp. fusiforme G11]
MNDLISDTTPTFTPSQPPSHLTNLDLSVLRTYASRSLTDQLDAILGPKTVIIDPTLAGPLGLVTEVTNLKEHGVDKLFWLEPGPLGNAGSLKNIVWVCKPNLNSMKIIAEQILSVVKNSSHNFIIFMTPRISQICKKCLTNLGVLGSLDLREFDLGLISLEKDLLSLEEEFGGFNQIFDDGDLTPNFNMAKAVMTIQRAFGLIPRLIGKGVAAKKFVNLLHRLRSEYVLDPGHGTTIPKLTIGSIDTMIILDRQIDMVTPMCTQLTYEGLLDEIFGIKHGHIEVSPELLAPSTPVAGNTAHSIPSSSTSQTFPHSRRKKHLLSSTSDPLFSELRDRNFALVGTTLNRIAKRINADYERRNEARTVKQIRDFVGRLAGLQNEHQALRLHTGLSEQIMTTTTSDEFNVTLEIQQNLVAGLDLSAQEKAISQLIDQEAPLLTILRLLCLYSLVNGGLKLKTLESFKRDILQTYGYHHLNLLIKLSKLNLLKVSNQTNSMVGGMIISNNYNNSNNNQLNFNSIRKKLKLIIDEIDEHEPNDISYTYSGYAPLSIRIIENLLNNNTNEKVNSDFLSWKSNLDEILKSFPGESFDEYQFTTNDSKSNNKLNGIPTDLHSSALGPKTCLICFLGGVTYAEVAALRFAFEQFNERKYKQSSIINGGNGIGNDRGRRLVVLTTGMVTGNSILNSLMPVETRV